METATSTANGICNYSDIIHEFTIKDLVQDLHKFNCTQNKWFFNPLKPGSYGFDNLATCFNIVLPLITHKDSSEKIADLIHSAWTINYCYWRDNKPWLRKDFIYYKPNKPINDERRNLCATTAYKNLPDDEKEKDLIIARWFQQKFLKEYFKLN